MHLLAFWKYENYCRDMDEFGGGYNFNSRQRVLHDGVSVGENLWLATLTRDRPERLIIVARLIVRDKTINAPGSPYGPYCVWGDKQESRYYLDDGKRDEHGVLSTLSYVGSSARGYDHRRTAQALQTIRKLTAKAHEDLCTVAGTLVADPRARPHPDEEAYEAYATGLSALPPSLPHPAIQQPRARLRAGRALAHRLHEYYRGRCQLCGFDPITTYGIGVCEVHHVVPLSLGGTHEERNAILLCPNHHRLVHRADAHFDYARLGFSFSHLGRYEPLVLNEHVPKADAV
ncbi:MAG: HNH endonuclease [Fimbriimonadia bacterium]|jgi:5-methylcytosine-specific restriction endonuclease McrA